MRRSPLRRIVFWISLAGFVAGCLFWLQFVPSRKERLWRAVPAEATWVLVQHDLADHWTGMAANPLVRALAEGMGFSPELLDSAVQIPALQTWLDRLAPDTLVLFRMPAYSRATDETTWAAVSWIGGQSQRLRWMLKGARWPGIRRVGEYHGRTLWVWEVPKAPSGKALYFAFEEGLVLACLSNHPSDLVRLLSAHDGLAPSFEPAAYGLDLSRRTLSSGVALDTGRLGPVTFAFDEIGPGRLSGRVQLLEGPPSLRAEALAPPAFLTERADMVFVIPSDLAGRWVLPVWHPDWLSELWPRLEPVVRRPIALGLFGGELSGRLFGLRVPALLAATPVTDDRQAVNHLLSLVDAMNARFQLGLIAGKSAEGEPALFTIEGTSGNAYANLAPEERAGFAVVNGWLIVSSHVGALRSILAGPIEASPAAPGDEPADLLQGWLKMGSGGKAIRSVLAVLTLQAAMQGEATRDYRIRLRSLRDWILALEALDRIDIRISQTGRSLSLEFSNGSGSQAPEQEASP
jgi:hypothetical protein